MQRVWSAVLALAVGTAGALALRALNAPVPYMLGSFLFTAVAALLRVPVALPGHARLLAVPAIGVMLGSHFNPEILGNILRWWDGMLATGIVTAVALIGGSWLYRKLAGVDTMTALLASTPGGAAEMTMLAEHYNVNRRVVALSQTLRVATTAFCLSIGLWLTGFGGLALPPSLSTNPSALDWAILVACAVLGAAVAIRLRIPAGAMLGPVVLSAAAHFSGITDAVPPAIVVNVAQVILGTGLGAYFTHIRDIRAGRIVSASIITTLAMICVAIGVAGVYQAVGLRVFTPTFLGIAPGGLSEMAVITVSLGIEVAFVTTCHVARLFLITGIAPIMAARLHKRTGARRKPDG